MSFMELENEAVFEALADLIDPASVIFADEEIKKIIDTKPKIFAIQAILRKYSKELVDMCAIIDGEPRETYVCNAPKLLKAGYELLKNKELMQFFT